MKMAIARALMAVSASCLGEGRREWALAMRAEFDVAAVEDRSLSFALGCAGAALRGMPFRPEGRFALANYALILGVMLPMAAFSITCGLFGLAFPRPALSVSGAMLRSMVAIHHAATPAVVLVFLLFACAHVRVAWAMLERDWDRVARTGIFAMAVAVTAIIVLSVLFLENRQAVIQLLMIAFEGVLIMLVAQWHAELLQSGRLTAPT